jgi:hypothetical protein
MPIACADFLVKYENSTKQLDYMNIQTVLQIQASIAVCKREKMKA